MSNLDNNRRRRLQAALKAVEEKGNPYLAKSIRAALEGHSVGIDEIAPRFGGTDPE